MRDNVKELFKNAAHIARLGKYNHPLYCNLFMLMENFNRTDEGRNTLRTLIDESMQKEIESESDELQTLRDQHLNILSNTVIQNNFSEAKIYLDEIINDFEKNPVDCKALRNIYIDALNSRGYIYMTESSAEEHSDPSRLEKAILLFDRAISHNCTAALYNRGYMHKNGLGCPQNITAALNFFERAVLKRNPYAVSSLIWLLNDNSGLVSRFPHVYLLTLGTELNSAAITAMLANRLRFFGWASPTDLAKSTLLYDRATELGFPELPPRISFSDKENESVEILINLSWDKITTNQPLGPRTQEIFTQRNDLLADRFKNIKNLKLLKQILNLSSNMHSLLSDGQLTELTEHLHKLEAPGVFLMGSTAKSGDKSPVRDFVGSGIFERRIAREIFELAGCVPIGSRK